MSKQPLENVVRHLFQIAARAEFKTLNDQDLLKRYIEYRDELAFGELVRRYEKMAWNVCWRILRNRQDTKDAFQACMMTLFQKASKIQDKVSIEGWLYSVAFKVAHNAKVARIWQRRREERSGMMREENYEDDKCRWELGEVLDWELVRISENYRSPLLLCYLDGLAQKEAAQRLGISIDALDRRLREGRERLKKRLSKYGMEWEHTMMMAQLAPGGHAPEVPPGLVERIMDMVRIMTLSNGALKTAGISPQVAALVKSVIGVGALKLKICLGVLLLTLAGVGAGVARYPGFFLQLMGWEQPQDRKPEPINNATINNAVDKPQSSQKRPHTDLYGDPLPLGALARLGTVRLRDNWRNNDREIVFTSDSEAVGLLSKGEMPRLWYLKTGEPVRRLGNSLKGGCRAGSRISLDGRRLAYTLSLYHI